MKEAKDGHPELGRTARTLGVRPDIRVDEDRLVLGGWSGMSVAPDLPARLPTHRRLPEYDGTGKDPIWELEAADLGEELGIAKIRLCPTLTVSLSRLCRRRSTRMSRRWSRRVERGVYYEPVVSIIDEFNAALASGDGLAGLRAAVERELQSDAPRERVICQLEALCTHPRADGRDTDDDVVLEVLDFVTGWCSPHVRL
jgi:hypothetical protein